MYTPTPSEKLALNLTGVIAAIAAVLVVFSIGVAVGTVL